MSPKGEQVPGLSAPPHLEMMSEPSLHPYQHQEEMLALGGRLRDLRTSRKLSLNVVAKGCGVTASMLSQVERGLVAPSLNTLYALSSYFNVGLFELFLEDQPWSEGQVIRKGQRRKVSFPGSAETYDLLTPTSQRSMSVLELVVPPDRGLFKHGVSHEGQECTVVVGGSARLDLGGAIHDLDEGDSIYYDAEIPHQFECLGTTEARLLLFMTPAI